MCKAEQNRQTQSRPKHCKKSSDPTVKQETVSDVDEVMLDGRLLHTREAATGNVRSPVLERLFFVPSVL